MTLLDLHWEYWENDHTGAVYYAVRGSYWWWWEAGTLKLYVHNQKVGRAIKLSEALRALLKVRLP